jgi:hypothetical protein
MLTAQELAQSLRQIAAHAKPGLIVDGQQRMVIELSQERVRHLLGAAGVIDYHAPAGEPDAGPEAEGMVL